MYFEFLFAEYFFLALGKQANLPCAKKKHMVILFLCRVLYLCRVLDRKHTARRTHGKEPDSSSVNAHKMLVCRIE